jgi:hypothetical protein
VVHRVSLPTVFSDSSDPSGAGDVNILRDVVEGVERIGARLSQRGVPGAIDIWHRHRERDRCGGRGDQQQSDQVLHDRS